MNTKNLSTMLLATVATLGIGMGSAFAQSSQSGYAFPDFWGNAVTQTAPQGNATAQSSGGSIGTYVTQSSHDGTWLFPPDPNAGGNS